MSDGGSYRILPVKRETMGSCSVIVSSEKPGEKKNDNWNYCGWIKRFFLRNKILSFHIKSGEKFKLCASSTHLWNGLEFYNMGALCERMSCPVILLIFFFFVKVFIESQSKSSKKVDGRYFSICRKTSNLLNFETKTVKREGASGEGLSYFYFESVKKRPNCTPDFKLTFQVDLRDFDYSSNYWFFFCSLLQTTKIMP